MQEINQIMSEALSAEPVEDEEQRQNLIDEVLEFVRGQDAYAAEVINYNTADGDADGMTTVWNDDIRRAEVEDPDMGDVEVFVRRNTNDYFVGVDMGGMMSMLGGGSSSSEMQYLHLSEEDMSEFGNVSIPEFADDYYEYVVQNGDVSLNGDNVIFECYIGTEDVDWLEPESFREDVITDGIHVVMAYNLEEERLDYITESVQNTDDYNTHSIQDFIYGVTFDFQVPNVGDDNVVNLGDMMGGLGGGGLGGGGLGGGGFGDGLGGGLDDALDDALGDTESFEDMAEDILGGDSSDEEEDSFF